MKINNFWGDLTDVPAKKEALVVLLLLLHASLCHESSCVCLAAGMWHIRFDVTWIVNLSPEHAYPRVARFRKADIIF